MQGYLLRQNMPAFKGQSWQILGCLPLTDKKSKFKKSSAVKDHMLFCDHIVSLTNFGN